MAVKKRKIRWTRWIILSVILLGGTYFIVQWTSRGQKPTEVVFAKAKYTKIVEKVSASGKIQPETEVKISPDVSGEIIDVYVKEGDSVLKGQLLLKIRPDNIRAAVENATANLNSRRANLSQSEADFSQRESELTRTKGDFERSKTLFDQKVVSEADFQLARMNFEVAQQRVESAKQTIEASKYNLQSSQATLNQSLDNLSRTEIYAPMSGSVSKLNVEKGEKVVGTAQMSGTEMLIIANLNRMEVRMNVNETDIVRVKVGQEAEIEVDSYTGRKFKGVVTEIANTAITTASADAVTEFQVKVRILNESYADLIKTNGTTKSYPFRPGMTATVDIITNVKDNVLSAPLAAVTTRSLKDDATLESKQKAANNNQQQDAEKKPIRTDEIQQVVFTHDEKTKKVSKKVVKTGISDFDNIEIIEGLSDGDQVVSGPFATVSKKLKDGDVVMKLDEKKGKGEGKN